MTTPPIPTFDVEPLEPVTLKMTLSLPNVRPDEVRAASQAFSSALSRVADCDAHADPELLVELLTRSLLSISYSLVYDPEDLLSYFASPRFDPWLEVNCEVLVPSPSGAGDNRRVLEEFYRCWSMDTYVRAEMHSSALLIAVGSLLAVGRLPMQEAPEPSMVN